MPQQQMTEAEGFVEECRRKNTEQIKGKIEMKEGTREWTCFSLIILASAAIIWGVSKLMFGPAGWLWNHYQLLGLVWGGAFIVVVIAILLAWRCDQAIKTLAATAIIAAAVVTPAKAGDPVQYEDYAAYNLVARFWSWASSFFTAGDLVQGITTSNQPVPQALANDAAAALTQPVPAPSGPATPSVYQVKQK